MLDIGPPAKIRGKEDLESSQNLNRKVVNYELGIHR